MVSFALALLAFPVVFSAPLIEVNVTSVEVPNLNTTSLGAASANAPIFISLKLPGNTTTSPTKPFTPGPTFKRAKRGIIGDDNRELWNSDEFPYKAMGYLELQTANGSLRCTGTLIGQRHVLTARHCIFDGITRVTFRPAYNNGDIFPSSDVLVMLGAEKDPDPRCNAAHDWAIFILSQPLGDVLGWLDLRIIDETTQINQPIFYHYGYPGDKGGLTPWRQEGITVSEAGACWEGSPLIFDADTEEGQSGGPLWFTENGNHYVVAVLVGAMGNSAVGAGGLALIEGYDWVRTHYF